MKLVSLISSGIDSPVATYLFLKQKMDIILIHGDNQPYTDERQRQNFIKLAQHLQQYSQGTMKILVVPHGMMLSELKKQGKTNLTCVLCKRMLIRYAELIAQREHADAIIMGDSLGQVASQTLKNMRVIDNVTSFSILRPLLGWDKEDIIKLAKQIGTYDLSILPEKPCSAVPLQPSTQAKLDNILEQEQQIDIPTLIQKIVKNAESISL